MQRLKMCQSFIYKWSAAALLATAFVMTGSANLAQTAAKSDAATQVLIENYKFNPAALTVKVGATVTWVNQDEDSHTVDGAQGKYKSKLLDKGDKFEFRFTEPGEYSYTCRLHPKMAGKITVQP